MRSLLKKQLRNTDTIKTESIKNINKRLLSRMALRKGKIVEAAGVQRSGGAGEKEEILGIRTDI